MLDYELEKKHRVNEHESTESLPQRHALVLAYYFPPVNESGALRPARFCKYLPQFGYKPVVVTTTSAEGLANPAPDVFQVSRNDGPKGGSVWRRFAIRILQRVLPYNDRIEWVPDAIATASKILRHTKIQVVISTSPPIATHMVALWLRWRHGVAWIADFRDPLVGNPYRNRWHGRLYDALMERWIVSWADAVIMNTDAALMAMKRRYPQSTKKFHLIWNGYDPDDECRPRPIPQRDHKIMVHVGSIYGGRHPGRLVDSIARLLERGHLAAGKFRLRLIGSLEHDMPWLAHSAFEPLVRAGLIEYGNEVVPRLEAYRQMAEADYLLLLDVNALGRGLQVPGKIFEYIRIGRPILAFTPSGSPVERILAQSEIPHTCIAPSEQDDEIDRKVLNFLSLSNKAVDINSWFRANFDGRSQTAVLARLVSAMTADRAEVS